MPESVDLTLIERIWSSTARKAEQFAERLPDFAAGLLLLLLAYVAAKFVTRAVRLALARTSTTGHVDIIIGRLAGSLVFTAGAMFAFSTMGFNVASLVTSLGLVTVAIGFALKDVLGNFMSGLLLLLQRPFSIGDHVRIADVSGRVVDIRLRDTLVASDDGTTASIPNQTVFNSVIRNDSVRSRRVEVDLSLAPSTDLGAAIVAIRDAMAGLPGAMKEPAPAAVVLGTVADGSAVTVSGRAWIDTKDTSLAEAKTAATVLVTGKLGEMGVLASSKG